jgi:hypothetical protein
MVKADGNHHAGRHGDRDLQRVDTVGKKRRFLHREAKAPATESPRSGGEERSPEL